MFTFYNNTTSTEEGCFSKMYYTPNIRVTHQLMLMYLPPKKFPQPQTKIGRPVLVV
jgi:hypothetical protein